MTSADFSNFLVRPFDRIALSQRRRSPQVVRTDFRAYVRRIYVRDSVQALDFELFTLSSVTSASHALPVRRTNVLPMTSFGLHLAMDTLAIRLAVPPAECTNKKTANVLLAAVNCC